MAVRSRSWRIVALSLVVSVGLQACGGGAATTETASGTDSPSGGTQTGTPVTPPPSTPTNHAPTISGTAPTAVQAGQAYSFKPAASDPDGDALTFSITNQPAWATFNPATGALTGTAPASGTFANVTIKVSDGSMSASLAAFTIAVSGAPAAVTGSATVSWIPPTTRSDGSALTNLAGYTIWYGPAQDNYTQSVKITNAGLTSYQVDNLAAGTYYFVVTAIDEAGNQSAYSAAVTKTIS